MLSSAQIQLKCMYLISVNTFTVQFFVAASYERPVKHFMLVAFSSKTSPVFELLTREYTDNTALQQLANCICVVSSKIFYPNEKIFAKFDIYKVA